MGCFEPTAYPLRTRADQAKAGRRLRPQPCCTGTVLFKGGGTGGEGCSPRAWSGDPEVFPVQTQEGRAARAGRAVNLSAGLSQPLLPKPATAATQKKRPPQHPREGTPGRARANYFGCSVIPANRACNRAPPAGGTSATSRARSQSGCPHPFPYPFRRSHSYAQ